jgi:hypothetical protein
MGGVDVEQVSDDELEAVRETVMQEVQRRWRVRNIPEQVRELNRRFLEDVERGMGCEWHPPEGLHDTYPLDWTVKKGGVEWVSAVDANTSQPDEGDDWVKVGTV